MFSRTRLASMLLCLCLGQQAHATCGQDYIVQRGDSLSKIAQDVLGRVFLYPAIHTANLSVIGPDPDVIRVGMRLTIPCIEASLDQFDWSYMPNPDDLARLQRDVTIQVLDIRSKKAIAKGLVPGSVWVPYNNWRGPKSNPGAPPDAAALAETIGNAGLRLDRPIVIVHAKPTPMDTGLAAYVYWMLKSVGADQIAILRGGYKAWVDADLPQADRPEAAPAYVADVDFVLTWRADALDVYGIATEQIPGHLLDARPHSIVNRVDKMGKAMATTLPAARNAPISKLMSTLRGEVNVEDGAQAVADHLLSHEADWREGMVVSFCSSGELAALNWFYASEIAGLENFRLYPESVKGWSADGGMLFEADNKG